MTRSIHLQLDERADGSVQVQLHDHNGLVSGLPAPDFETAVALGAQMLTGPGTLQLWNEAQEGETA